MSEWGRNQVFVKSSLVLVATPVIPGCQYITEVMLKMASHPTQQPNIQGMAIEYLYVKLPL